MIAILRDDAGASAGGLQACGAVALRQSEHALGAPEAIEGPIAEQALDELRTGRADLGGVLRNPLTPHQEVAPYGRPWVAPYGRP